MLFAELANVSDLVSQQPSRKRKIARISALLVKVDREEAYAALKYLVGELPQGRIGLGYSTVAKVKTPPSTAATLAVLDVQRALDTIAATKGGGSRRRRNELLVALFARATESEQLFLKKLLIGELRQGALQGVMIEALADAADVPPAAVRRAVMVSGDLAEVGTTLLAEGEQALASFRLQLGTPLQSMLAQPVASVDEAVELLQEPLLEYKLDGARVQVHRAGSSISVFSRRLNDVTASLPEVVELAAALPADRFILDGEVLTTADNGRPLPFQVTMKRFGRNRDVARLRNELPASAYFFDCLHLDGDDLIDRGTVERRDALSELVDEERRVAQLQTASTQAARAFFASARDAGHEGLMAKAPAAPYLAGNRGQDWLKIKVTHTLDLVVLGAEWGSGRRRGKLSNIHLGARDDDGFVMLGKTFKGMTDKLLAWQTEALLALETHRDRHVVYVRPELVVEIAFDGVQASRQYPGGVALRFARVRGYRPDKSPSQADTLEAVQRIHQNNLPLK